MPHVVTASTLLLGILSGDVVYLVTVELEAQPDGLRAGMSAVVGL